MTLRAQVDFAGEGVNFGAGVDSDKCAIDADKHVQIALLRSLHGYLDHAPEPTRLWRCQYFFDIYAICVYS